MTNWHGDYFDIPQNVGAKGGDNDNKGWQMDRRTYHGGDHSHAVSGWANTGIAMLTETGNEGEHENRPPLRLFIILCLFKNNI